MENAIEELKLSYKKVETVGDSLPPTHNSSNYPYKPRETCPNCGKYYYEMVQDLAGQWCKKYHKCHE